MPSQTPTSTHIPKGIHPQPKVALIAAMSSNRVIGRDNQLPWHISEDLKRFKQLTLGSPIIMGRKTYESIGRVLPGRKNIILSRRPGYHVEGATVLPSLEEALAFARELDPLPEEVFVIGGAEIYHQALPVADRMYLTEVHQDVTGDAFFPEWNAADFVQVSREDRSESSAEYPPGHLPGHIPLSYSFILLERVH